MVNTKHVLIIIAVVVLGIFVFLIPSKKESPHTNGTENTVTTTQATTTEGMKASTTQTTVVKKTTSTGAVSSQTTSKTATTVTKSSVGRLAPEFKDPTGYTNVEPFLMKDVLGKKVIVVNFITSSSIASLRTLPYLNQWHAKYKDKGLLVLAIHTPRFEFERYKDNVDNIAHENNILYPIISDNKYGTWHAYGNKDWPHQYIIDTDGRIIYDHSGEGGYESIESKIQETIASRAGVLGVKSFSYSAFEAPKDAISVLFSAIKSPETYFGYLNNTTIGNAVTQKEGQQDIEFKDTSKLNVPYLSGSWYFKKEYAENMIEGAQLRYTFNAKRVFMVFGSLRMNKVKVLLDGAPLGEAAGRDIRVENGQSYLYVSDERIYEIVDNNAGYGQHTIEFVFETPGIQIYTMMFG